MILLLVRENTCPVTGATCSAQISNMAKLPSIAGAAEQRPYSHLLASPGSPVLSPSPEPQAAAGSPHDRDPAPFDSPSPSSSLAVPVSMSTAAVDSPGGKSTLAPRHMALGMSRRASVCIAHPPADTAFQDQPR